MKKSDLDTAPRLPAPPEAPIPVICDLCQCQGEAGSDPFESLGDLLRFTPVQRRRVRADGWSEEYQRAFIAALAVTGSPRRAAGAIGKHEFGAQQLRRARGGASFAAAWDAAIDIHRETELAGMTSGLAELAAEQDEERAQRRDLIRPRSSPDRGGEPFAKEQMVEGPRTDENISEAEHELRTLEIYRQYLVKVELERKARLAGRVVEADFTLRQLTFFECALDLAQDGNHIDTWTWLANLRRDGHGLIEIAQTPFSRFLDEARRMSWEGKMTGLDQPMPTPEEYLRDYRHYFLEPPECTWGGQALSHQQQLAEQEARHRKAAMEQVEWEARAQSVRGSGRASSAGGGAAEDGEH